MQGIFKQLPGNRRGLVVRLTQERQKLPFKITLKNHLNANFFFLKNPEIKFLIVTLTYRKWTF